MANSTWKQLRRGSWHNQHQPRRNRSYGVLDQNKRHGSGDRHRRKNRTRHVHQYRKNLRSILSTRSSLRCRLANPVNRRSSIHRSVGKRLDSAVLEFHCCTNLHRRRCTVKWSSAIRSTCSADTMHSVDANLGSKRLREHIHLLVQRLPILRYRLDLPPSFLFLKR